MQFDVSFTCIPYSSYVFNKLLVKGPEHIEDQKPNIDEATSADYMDYPTQNVWDAWTTSTWGEGEGG